VGQGDAAYIRIHNQIDVLIDAGPDNSVLRCLNEHMPFYDRTIEMAFISHPQKDHYFGFLEIGRRYKILNMFMTPLKSKNESFRTLLKILALNQTHIYFPHEGMHLTVGNNVKFYILLIIFRNSNYEL
jgi:competence protein ComEC